MTRIPIDDDNTDNANPFADETPVGDQPEAAEPVATGRAPVTGGSAAAPADVSKLQQERDALFERLARTQADFKNAQKRLEADAEQRAQYANSALIKSLLPVIDNFERALSVDPAKTDAASILKGLQIVHDQLIAVLRGQNVEEIAPQPGEPFDPTRHEALLQQDAPQYKEPTVTQLLQKGYALRDRTLRPAGVAVSRAG
jgi:molecular chaperone GrpE